MQLLLQHTQRCDPPAHQSCCAAAAAAAAGHRAPAAVVVTAAAAGTASVDNKYGKYVSCVSLQCNTNHWKQHTCLVSSRKLLKQLYVQRGWSLLPQKARNDQYEAPSATKLTSHARNSLRTWVGAETAAWHRSVTLILPAFIAPNCMVVSCFTIQCAAASAGPKMRVRGCRWVVSLVNVLERQIPLGSTAESSERQQIGGC